MLKNDNLWREKIVEATRRGQTKKAKSGKVVGVGRTLHGYWYEDGRFVIVEEEAGIVRLIYVWYTGGDERGKPLSVFQICKRLSEMGIKTPGERSGYRRKRKPHMRNTTIIHNILRNETYAGVW